MGYLINSKITKRVKREFRTCVFMHQLSPRSWSRQQSCALRKTEAMLKGSHPTTSAGLELRVLRVEPCP